MCTDGDDDSNSDNVSPDDGGANAVHSAETTLTQPTTNSAHAQGKLQVCDDPLKDIKNAWRNLPPTCRNSAWALRTQTPRH